MSTIKVTRTDVKGFSDIVRSADALWSSLRNDAGKPILTNIPTPLCGNLPRSGKVVFLKGDEKTTVTLSNDAIARDANGYNKSASTPAWIKLQSGDIKESSVLFALSYWILNVVRANLPTDSKPSGTATIMTTLITESLRTLGISVQTVTFGELSYDGDTFSGLLKVFTANAEHIKNTWSVKQSRRNRNTESIDL